MEYGKINIDKFLIWTLKNFDCSGSIFLHSFSKNNK